MARTATVEWADKSDLQGWKTLGEGNKEGNCKPNKPGTKWQDPVRNIRKCQHCVHAPGLQYCWSLAAAAQLSRSSSYIQEPPTRLPLTQLSPTNPTTRQPTAAHTLQLTSARRIHVEINTPLNCRSSVSSQCVSATLCFNSQPPWVEGEEGITSLSRLSP